jgi:hypothetical protein
MLSKLSQKKFILVLKLQKLYLFGPSIVFSIQFWCKNYFFYFLIPGLRKKTLDSSAKEKKISIDTDSGNQNSQS